MATLNGASHPLEQGGPNRQNMQQDLRGQPSQASMKTGSLGSDFFKIFGGGGGNKKAPVTREGQLAKRRGPKPDSKPAMTRRQELNRQAQRTHRERKEQYMRSLETEISRLREAYTQEISSANVTMQNQKQLITGLMDETEILKDILTSQGINFEADLERRKAERRVAGFQASPITSGSVGSQTIGAPPSSSHVLSGTPPTTVSASLSPRANGGEFSVSPTQISPTQDFSIPTQAFHSGSCDVPTFDRSLPTGGCDPVQPMGGVFEDDPQLQIDFILTLESPCREHTDYLCRRSITEADDEDMPFSGHALMASCPPPTYIATTTPEQAYPHITYDLPHANLTTLLNLSRQLVTESQMTPIMALQNLKNHEAYRKLSKEDVKIIIETLETKVRCYGFGAVVEDFEMQDCLSSVLGGRVEVGCPDARDDFMYS